MSQSVFAITETAEIEVMLSSVRFGSLVTHGPQGLSVTHMPFVYDAATRTLRGHVACANAQFGRDDGGDALATFVGPNAYVSPNHYPSKQQHGRVVPTWNYESVDAFGSLRWIEDAGWLHANLTALTDRFEAGQWKPWAVSDAPADYIDRLVTAIVGVELSISRVEARRKLSQNRAEPDRLGVLAGLSGGNPGDQAVAALMREQN